MITANKIMLCEVAIVVSVNDELKMLPKWNTQGIGLSQVSSPMP